MNILRREVKALGKKNNTSSTVRQISVNLSTPLGQRYTVPMLVSNALPVTINSAIVALMALRLSASTPYTPHVWTELYHYYHRRRFS